MKAGVGNVHTFQDLSWQAPLQFLCEVPVRCAVFTPGKGLSHTFPSQVHRARIEALELSPYHCLWLHLHSSPSLPCPSGHWSFSASAGRNIILDSSSDKGAHYLVNTLNIQHLVA